MCSVFSTDDDFNNLSVIIGAVIGVCVVVILLVILVVAAVLCVKQKKIKKKKFLTRQDSQNEYSEQPSKMRLLIIQNMQYVVCRYN